MVAYLTKSDASEGFNQIIDFLDGCYIKYALTVNPNIYVSCIKQFWNTVAIKQVNDITRLRALVDKKKVVVTKAAIREVLRLDDAEGVDCLPNEEIFAELARMGYEKLSTKLTFYKAFFSSQWKFLIHTILQSMSAKRTSWNEFSSTMASAVICLSTGKGFSGVETPLFEGIIVGQVIEEGGDAEEHVQDVTDGDAAQGDDNAAQGDNNAAQGDDTAAHGEGRIIDELDKNDAVALMDDKEEDKKEEEAKVVEDYQVQGRQAKSQAEIYKIDIDHASKVLIRAATITTAPAKVAAASSRRRKGVVIRDPEEESTTSSIISDETKSKDKGKGIIVEEPKPLKKKQQIEMDEEYLKAKEDPVVQRYQAMKRKPQTEAQAQKNMMIY
nr:hypothetical protein [Tanacetum cinerariifolium]GEZ35674.1 hypothetical protein [Tanacetum cinerariifolium]